jgi:formate dehydrogenase subunit gamma
MIVEQRDTIHEIRGDDGEPIVRYTLRERVMHWLAGLSYLYLLASGLALFTPLLYWLAAVILHEIGALVTIGAFIIHVYMGLFVVPGGFRAIVHGYVSRGWARTHHRLWYERISGSGPT